MKKRVFIFFAIIFWCFVVSAGAVTMPYVSLDAGAAFNNKQEIFVSKTNNINMNGSLFGVAAGVNFAETLRLKGGIRAELSYHYSGFYNNFTGVSPSYSLTRNTSDSHKTAMLTGYYDIGQFNHFIPYIGVGIGFDDFDNTYVQTGTFGTDYVERSQINFAYSGNAGVNYAISNNWEIGVGYIYIDYGKTAAVNAGIYSIPSFATTSNQVMLRATYNIN